MTKKEYNDLIRSILNVSKLNYESAVAFKNNVVYTTRMNEISEHDPKLAELCRAADHAHIEPLLNIVKYLSNRLES